MKSPFPGMNPYLESRWSNVHVLMMGAITGELNASLPDGLEARPEEEIRIETLAGERLQGFRPEVAIVDMGAPEASVPAPSGAVAVAEPIRLAYHSGPVVLRNVQIVDTSDHDRVVTVIEVLSPGNKLPGKLNKDYLAKLDAFEQAGSSWVEIDLLRSSRSSLAVTWQDLPEPKRLDYLVVACVAWQDDLLLYPISLRERLPAIHIPLRQGDAHVALDLQAVLQRVYKDGAFNSLNYSKQLEPPLSPADAEWAAGLIAGRQEK